MASRSETLTLGRRLHNALRHAIEDPDAYANGRVTREHFEHYACSMYLAGTLAFLEGKYGKKPWRKPDFAAGLDAYLALRDDKRKGTLLDAGISENGLEALVCIRNAVVHNDADLSKNSDRNALAKVATAAIRGVSISGNLVQLTSNSSVDFMEYVRKAFVAVSMFHGDL